jgi:hypothetical protein
MPMFNPCNPCCRSFACACGLDYRRSPLLAFSGLASETAGGAGGVFLLNADAPDPAAPYHFSTSPFFLAGGDAFTGGADLVRVKRFGPTEPATPDDPGTSYANVSSWFDEPVPHAFNGVTSRTPLKFNPTLTGMTQGMFGGVGTGMRVRAGGGLRVRCDQGPAGLSVLNLSNFPTAWRTNYGTCCGDSVMGQYPGAATWPAGVFSGDVCKVGWGVPGGGVSEWDGFGMFPDYGAFSPGRPLVLARRPASSFRAAGCANDLPALDFQSGSPVNGLALALDLSFPLIPSLATRGDDGGFFQPGSAYYNALYGPLGASARTPWMLTRLGDTPTTLNCSAFGLGCVTAANGDRVMLYAVTGLTFSRVTASPGATLYNCYSNWYVQGVLQVTLPAGGSAYTLSAALRVRPDWCVLHNVDNLPYMDVCLVSTTGGTYSCDPFTVNVPMALPSNRPNSLVGAVATLRSA